MPPLPYLLHVNSRPTVVSSEVWRQWYVTEHLPDLVNSKTATRAAFYEEIAMPAGPESDHPRKFLAIYQTDIEEALLSEQCRTGVHRTSELFKQGGAKSDRNEDNGDFDVRNYRLIQNYDPNGLGDQPAPSMLTAELHPQDVDDLEAWYREEHLDMLAKVPGYRRSLRYKIGPTTAVSKGEAPDYIALHEVDDVTTALQSQEAEAAKNTPWTKKQMADSKVFVARAWKLVKSLGY